MDILKVYILDIILGLIFLLCVGYYYRKGFARSVMDFFSFFVSGVITKLFYGDVTQFLLEKTEFFNELPDPSYVAKLVSIVGVFIVASIAIKVLINIIDKAFKLPLIKTANKILGLLIGIIMGFLIVTVVCIITDFVASTGYEPVARAVSNSYIIELDSKIVDMIFPEISKLI